MSSLTPEQAATWVSEIRSNVADFRKKPRLNDRSKLEFISRQYSSLFVLVRVLRGDTELKGFPFSKLNKE